MKKFTALFMVLAVILSLSACGGAGNQNDVYTPDGASTDTTPAAVSESPNETNTSGEEVVADVTEASDEEAIVAVQLLFEKAAEYAGNDYDRFSALYRNTTDEAIQSDYEWDFSAFELYEKDNYVVVCRVDNFFYVNKVSYIVTGTHPDTHMESKGMSFCVSLVDDEWKFDYNANDIEKLNEKMSETPSLYPEGFYQESLSGHNAVSFASWNYMYMSSSSIYEGCSNSEVKFAWQDETGNLYVALWLANGTNNNLYYTNCELTLIDNTLGTIIDYVGELNEPVKALNSRLVTIEIPASDVLSGGASWGSVSSSLSVRQQ